MKNSKFKVIICLMKNELFHVYINNITVCSSFGFEVLLFIKEFEKSKVEAQHFESWSHVSKQSVSFDSNETSSNILK
ncbi:hypothetical protein BpHYR1_047770 [Brachionus plicatilis]|uniref:Uncharacterized protein n=1 Tax=Brachionus plicatilis TaxID=10195 RepID=A0A3M7T8G8_BRAPC|nr:hypothetical protein BpHYR1_047770 [Brachionus plicatilis]